MTMDRVTRIRIAVPLLLPMLMAGCDSPSQPTGPSETEDSGQTEELHYEFGAKFEPPLGRVVHALGQWQEYNLKYSALVGAEAQPVSELIFLDIGDTPRGWDPALIAGLVSAVDARGRIPHIDIALRGLQIPGDSIAKLPNPYFGIDHDIANGAQYDGRIQDLIEIVRDYGRPVMMRIGGEFNGSWNGYHPYEYPKAFRKIVMMFRQAKVENVAFIWCYEPAAPGDFAEQNAAGEYRWYPGADVIDWYSVDLFAAADVSGAVVDARGESPYGRVLEFLDMAVADGKPVIIAESSPAHYDLSDSSQSTAAWAEWFTPYFDLIANRREIKWFHYINYDWSKANSYVALGWKNNDLADSPSLAADFIDEISGAKYLHSDEKALLNGYTDHE